MRGEASLTSDRTARDAFAPRLRQAGLGAENVAEELFTFARVLDANPKLERAITNPGRDTQDKSHIIDALLGGKVSNLVIDILHDLVGRRWSREDHIANAVEDFAVDAIMYYADARDVTAKVARELSQIHSALLNLPVVRSKLSDTTVDPQVRVRFLDELLEGQQLDEATMVLARHATHDLRNRRFLATLLWLINKLSRHMGEMMVTVTSAVPLTSEETSRIVTVYTARTGMPVHINSVVDPKVIGGLRIQYGSEVRDSTVAAQLVNLRRSVSV